MDQLFPDWKALDITHRVAVNPSVQPRFGGHSDVYCGTMDQVNDRLPSTVAVAVKIHRYSRDEVSRNMSISIRVVDEVSIWRSLEHPNIVPFYGSFCPATSFRQRCLLLFLCGVAAEHCWTTCEKRARGIHGDRQILLRT
ncbi:hypothetical protein EXIGLDRAFT_58004 [Exidia glandulosa HHB12029]|uniref:Protein kinase domain-containing protein n=1 Tax=Exidia glandulosa HHB12029 TaxID=1314781 RepID=A0A165I669_EXIGL|nr:hypothetical protein EXIGLDRAFT_58004 [Exidia glandulosa HHB12029]